MLLRPVVGVGGSELEVAAGGAGRRGDDTQDLDVLGTMKCLQDDGGVVLERAEEKDGGHVSMNFNRMQLFGGRF